MNLWRKIKLNKIPRCSALRRFILFKLIFVTFFKSIIFAPNLKITTMTNKNDASIEARVKKIIVDKLGVDEKEVTPQASFTNDLGADSLDTVELIMDFEKEFLQLKSELTEAAQQP